MLYPYITFADDTEVLHSQIMEENGKQEIVVHFERPTEDGFDSARCQLPEYKWLFIKGYSESEIKNFEEFLMHNAHLLYQYAASGGIQIA
jgi:hypothetical protein